MGDCFAWSSLMSLGFCGLMLHAWMACFSWVRRVKGAKDDRQHVPPHNFSLEVEELILPDLIMRIGQNFGFRVRLWVPMRPPTRSTNAFFLEKLGFLKDWKDRADPKTLFFFFGWFGIKTL